MSTGVKSNRLVLKIGVVYDSADALKQAKNLQKTLDKQYEKTIDKKMFQEADNAIMDMNSNIVKQQGLVGRLFKGWDKTLTKMVQSFTLGLVFYNFVGNMAKAISLVTELDTAYTNLAIVSKMNATELATVDARINDLTTSLGRMKKEVIDSVTEFSRAGYDIADSMLLAENAIQGANVGATSLEKVTTFLIAGLKSFKMEAEDSARILDVLFTVANITAIDLEGIGEAFLRSANTLKNAGASLEEATALLAAANESIQDPAKVGTALKTIASRLRGVGDEGEVIPTLAKDFEAVGVAIQNADGSFRNIYDVFRDFSQVYKNLDDLTRQSLLEKLAGKRQINIMIGLLENFDLAEKSLEAGINSAGSVALAQEKYVKSLEGRFNLLREAFNRFLVSLSDTESLKTMVTLLTNLINTITFVIQKIPILISAITGISVAIGVLNPVIGLAVGGFFALQQAFNLFGDKTDEIAGKINKLSSEIEDLNARIAQSKATEERTGAENELLSVLEEQLAVKEKLLKAEQVNLGIAFDKNLNKDLNETGKIIEEVTYQFENYGDIIKSNADDAKGFIDRLQNAFYENELALLSNIEESQKALDTLDDTDAAYSIWVANLKKAEDGLELLRSTAEKFGFQINNVTKYVDEFGNSLNKLPKYFDQALASTKEAKDNYQLLSDAIIAVTDNGYLSDDMLNELIETYPDIIALTNLTAEGMEKYAETNRVSSEQIARDAINLLKTQKGVFQEQLKLYEESMRLLASGLGNNEELMYNAQFALASGTINQANAAIRNANNNIAILENQLKAFDGINKARQESLKETEKSNTEKEKEIRLLTDAESAVRALNQRISQQQKIMSRTEGYDAQIFANQKMIMLYEELKKALIARKQELDAEGKSLKRGQDGYEDYIEASMKLSLEIEDATTNIYQFGKAISDLEADKEAKRVDKLKESIKSLNDDLKDEVDTLIDKEKELAKASAKYYDDKISGIQDEIDALKEQNDIIDEQVQLQEMLLDLQELRERRQNILNNKNVRVVRDSDVGFEWISDPRELEQVNKDILDAEQAIDKFRRDLIVNENTRRLELEIERLEKEAKLEQESYDKRIDDLETFQDSMNQAIEENQTIPLTLVQTLQSSLEGAETGSYATRLSNLSSFISDYNSRIAQLASTPAMPTEVATPPSVTSSTSTYVKPSSSTSSIKPTSVGTGSISSSLPSASSTANKIQSSVSQTQTKPPISVNQVNVTSTAKTVDAIVTDAINKVKVMSY